MENIAVTSAPSDAGKPPPVVVNHSIRDKRKGHPNFHKQPELLTLMAIGLDSAGKAFWARTYRTRIRAGLNDAEIMAVEKRLTDIAVSDKLEPGVDEISRNVDKIDFSEVSYFTIVICWEDWNFHYTSMTGEDQFIFYVNKSALGIIELVSQKQPNWSFFDGIPTMVDKFHAVRTINHFKVPYTEDYIQSGQSFEFGFNIYLSLPLMPWLPGSADRVVIIVDPTGENKGP